jgi:DNA-binding transcriptional ArsR family regulator
MVISDLAVLRVLTDPLRARLVMQLRITAATAAELAEALAEPVKKLYYHLGLLERHGLIRVVATRVVSGIIEKRYRTTAYLFKFADEVFAPTDDALPEGVQLLFESTRNELAQSYVAGKTVRGAAALGRVASSWSFQFLDEARIEEFSQRLHELATEFAASASDAPDAIPYRLFYTFFPTTHSRAQENPND